LRFGRCPFGQRSDFHRSTGKTNYVPNVGAARPDDSTHCTIGDVQETRLLFNFFKFQFYFFNRKIWKSDSRINQLLNVLFFYLLRTSRRDHARRIDTSSSADAYPSWPCLRIGRRARWIHPGSGGGWRTPD
jgi:hypothetical protein